MHFSLQLKRFGLTKQTNQLYSLISFFDVNEKYFELYFMVFSSQNFNKSSNKILEFYLLLQGIANIYP